MKDVQSEKDYRNIKINKVGIKDLSYPINVMTKDNNYTTTVAKINMYVDLPEHFRGTHMSRFLEVLSRHHLNLKLTDIESILDDMKKTFKSKSSHLEISFPYFIKKKAPKSKIESFMEYICFIQAELEERLNLTIGIEVPVHNLCPCSKEISINSAHNQRGKIIINVKSNKFIWFEELIEIAENSASTPLYSLLKRQDEKYITEKAYSNPKFVEDCARDVALKLKNDKRIKSFSVEVINYESIHNHNAYAFIISDDMKV